MPRQSLAFFALLSSGLVAVACGDSGSTSAGTTGTGGSTSATTATGTGGGTTTATTGTGGGTTTTTTTGAGGAAPTNACTNAADAAILMMIDAAGIVGKCGQDNFGAEPATTDCIKKGTGLSDDCVVCFAGTVSCVVANCLNECISDPGSAACKMCRAEKCDPAFEMCSGLDAGG